MNRRDFLQLPLAPGVASLGSATRSAGAPRIDEHDPGNTKIATMVSFPRVTDDHLLYLQQIGLRWVHAEFGNDAPYDTIKTAQERLARYNLKIHCGILE